MSRPRVRGLVSALRTLRGPLEFEPIPPSLGALPYANPSARPWHTTPLADVYLPPGPGPHPSVLLVHGGGFLIGDRAMKPMRRLTTALVQEGYAAVSVDYRKIGRGGSHLRGADDVARAMEWWFEQVDTFDLDPERVGAVGLSAGATLMLMASEQGHAERLASRVAIFGLYDISAIGGPLARVIRLLLLRGGDPRAVSPRYHLRAERPLTIIHGTADQLVPVRQARDLALARRAGALPVELVEIEGAPHGFFNTPGAHCEAGLSALVEALKRDFSTSP